MSLLYFTFALTIRRLFLAITHFISHLKTFKLWYKNGLTHFSCIIKNNIVFKLLTWNQFGFDTVSTSLNLHNKLSKLIFHFSHYFQDSAKYTVISQKPSSSLNRLFLLVQPPQMLNKLIIYV